MNFGCIYFPPALDIFVHIQIPIINGNYAGEEIIDIIVSEPEEYIECAGFMYYFDFRCRPPFDYQWSILSLSFDLFLD